MKRGGPLRRTGPPARKTRLTVDVERYLGDRSRGFGSTLRRRSDRQAKVDDELSVLRQRVFERDGHACQIGLRCRGAGRCDGGLELSHTIPRGRDVTRVLDVDNCLTVCSAHHRRIHGNPEWASTVGLMGSAGDVVVRGWVVQRGVGEAS